MLDDLLTVAEVSALLRLKPWAVYQNIGRGTIPAVRIGRQVRVSRVALENALEAARVVRRLP